MSEELKPCPFCGGKAIKSAYDRGIDIGCEACGYSRHFRGLLQSVPNEKPITQYRNGPGGITEVPPAEAVEFYHADANERAAEEWNHRAPVAARELDVEAERLLRAAKVYAFNYMQDEAEDEEDCVCGPKQHAEAKEVFEAIREFEEARAARSAAQSTAPVSTEQAGDAWISVEDRLPEKECLAAYSTPNGKVRLIRAKYARKFQIEAEDDDCETEYNEDDDTFYIKEGWLECIDNWGEYSSCYVVEGIVTHWMPLPAAPSPNNSPVGGKGEQ